MQRIQYMDGFRGLAILLVILYHAFARGHGGVPYGDMYADIVFFKYGWLGVELFFLLSGFVILMTLEKCSSFFDFMKKRWLRLFPAMLVATILIYATAHIFSERPAGMPRLMDIFPGLFFIEPSWINKFSNLNIGVLEGAFWSLFVEVKFYFVFGGLYFIFNKKWAETGIGICFLISVLGTELVKYAPSDFANQFHLNTDYYLSFQYFGWFLLGSISYDLFKKRDTSKLLFAAVLAVFVSWYGAIGRNDLTFLMSFSIVLIFYATIYFEPIQSLFTQKFFVLLGFVSYPLYLIHENMMIAMLKALGKIQTGIPGILLPVIPVALLVGLAYLISKYIEPFVKKGILDIFSKFSGMLPKKTGS